MPPTKLWAPFLGSKRTLPVTSWAKGHDSTKGIPQTIYADQHTIFQALKRSSGEDFSARETSTSYFGTLLKDLGIELKAARSPQAKGRIERLWGTLQDRLIKSPKKSKCHHPG